MKRDLVFLKLEHRLTLIESGVSRSWQSILIGAVLMSLSLIGLILRVGKQNGRVSTLETTVHDHGQESKTRQIWPRLDELEEWRRVEEESKAVSDGIEADRMTRLEKENEKNGRNRKWFFAIVTGLATGGSTVVGLLLKIVFGFDF